MNCEEKLEEIEKYCKAMKEQTLVGSPESQMSYAILNMIELNLVKEGTEKSKLKKSLEERKVEALERIANKLDGIEIYLKRRMI